MITDFLGELSDALPVPPRQRRRILAEVEDHLLCAAADLHAGGLTPAEAERRAVTAFGDAAELGRELTLVEDSRRTHLAGWLSLPLAIVAGWLGIRGSIELSVPFPLGTVPFVLAQVGVVAAALSVARALLVRRRRPADRVALGVLVRRGALVAGACAAGQVVVLGGALAARGGVAPAIGWVGGALVMLLGGALARALRRSRGAAGPLPEDHDALVEIGLVLGPQWGERIERLVGLRRRPWRFASAVAGLAGIGLAGAHGIAEGPPDGGHLVGAGLAALIIASVEATAVIATFGVLGRWLGLRARAEIGAQSER